MTEEIPAAPGWVDEQLDDVFAPLAGTAGVAECRAAYANCISATKAPAAPSDMLGAEFEGCRTALRRGLLSAGVDAAALAALEARLEVLEAEFAAQS